jgi:Fur family transcriptional regulator, ferric uptake regulator
MSESAKKILVENHLKVTQNRLDVLSLFMSDSKAYSLLQLETIFGKKHNRSSIFRCLQVLTDFNVLEKFVDASGIAVYVLNTKPASNSHSHFKCNNCENVQQLPELPAEYLTILGKNKIEATNLFIQGTCEKCQEN